MTEIAKGVERVESDKRNVKESSFLSVIPKQLVVLLMAALWASSFVFASLSSSTIFSVRVVMGLFLGSVTFLFAAVACAVFSWVVFLVTRNIHGLRQRSKILLITAPAIISAIAFISLGLSSSRPSARFRDFFEMRLPASTEVSSMDGTCGIDGVIWVFSCKTTRADLDAILNRGKYTIEPDNKGEAYWSGRIASRTEAKWQVTTPYVIYVSRKDRAERRIFASQTDSSCIFVYCSFSHGL